MKISRKANDNECEMIMEHVGARTRGFRWWWMFQMYILHYYILGGGGGGNFLVNEDGLRPLGIFFFFNLGIY